MERQGQLVLAEKSRSTDRNLCKFLRGFFRKQFKMACNVVVKKTDFGVDRLRFDSLACHLLDIFLWSVYLTSKNLFAHP